VVAMHQGTGVAGSIIKPVQIGPCTSETRLGVGSIGRYLALAVNDRAPPRTVAISSFNRREH